MGAMLALTPRVWPANMRLTRAGDLGKDIGVVGEEDHGFLRVGLRERRGDVWSGGPQVGDAAQPEWIAVVFDVGWRGFRGR